MTLTEWRKQAKTQQAMDALIASFVAETGESLSTIQTLFCVIAIANSQEAEAKPPASTVFPNTLAKLLDYVRDNIDDKYWPATATDITEA